MFLFLHTGSWDQTGHFLSFCLLGFRGIFRHSAVPRFRLLGFGVIFRRSAIPRFHLLGFGGIFRRSVIPPFRRSIIPAFRVARKYIRKTKWEVLMLHLMKEHIFEIVFKPTINFKNILYYSIVQK